MLFNSYIFILVFLPVVLAGYYILGKKEKYQAAKWYLVAASLVFYAYHHVSYLLLICISLAANYLLSAAMMRSRDRSVRKRLLFLLSLFVNLGILFYFKYFNFFMENMNVLFSKSFQLRNIVLPLGISFYTFQQISYVADVYTGKAEGYSFADYALFVTFFPQLVAGPIALHSEMIPQFREKESYRFQADHFAEGIYDFSIGLAKKVLIADKFGMAVRIAFDEVPSLTTGEAWLIILSYALQIYFDFSGYCDMASGISEMFNFRLPVNFRSPYKSKSIPEFWQRWHATLGRFLRQYVYFPLGGSRKGKIRTYLNLLAVFFVSGLWHGANWTFVLWGVFNGIMSCLHRLWHKWYDRLFAWLRCLLTFVTFNIGLVLFRAESVSQAGEFYGRMFLYRGLKVRSEISSVFHITGMNRVINAILPFSISPETVLMLEFTIWTGSILLIVFLGKNIYEQQRKTTKAKAALSAFCLITSLLSFTKVSEFLYFNF